MPDPEQRQRRVTVCRYILGLHVLNLIFELGVVSVTFLNLFSQRLNPMRESQRHQEQLSVMLVSLVTTLLTFGLTLVGAGSSLAGLREVVARVSQSGTRFVAGRRSLAGNRVVPMNGNPFKLTEESTGNQLDHGVACHRGASHVHVR